MSPGAVIGQGHSLQFQAPTREYYPGNPPTEGKVPGIEGDAVQELRENLVLAQQRLDRVGRDRWAGKGPVRGAWTAQSGRPAAAAVYRQLEVAGQWWRQAPTKAQAKELVAT